MGVNEKVCYLCGVEYATYILDHVPVCHKCMDRYLPPSAKPAPPVSKPKIVPIEQAEPTLPGMFLDLELPNDVEIDLEWYKDGKTPTI